MNRVSLLIALLCASAISSLAPKQSFAQGAALQAVRGAAESLENNVANNQNPITAGPADKQEKQAPGKVDPNAPAEFKTTTSGLKYRILRKVEGRKPIATDTVVVHYKGWLNDKTIFDSSYRRGETISFPLNQVIKGWTEGVQLMGVGEMIELDIPYQLAYGERGTPGGPIPPKAQLHFVIELVSIK